MIASADSLKLLVLKTSLVAALLVLSTSVVNAAPRSWSYSLGSSVSRPWPFSSVEHATPATQQRTIPSRIRATTNVSPVEADLQDSPKGRTARPTVAASITAPFTANLPAEKAAADAPISVTTSGTIVSLALTGPSTSSVQSPPTTSTPSRPTTSLPRLPAATRRTTRRSPVTTEKAAIITIPQTTTTTRVVTYQPTGILFPGQEHTVVPPSREDRFVPECDGVPYTAWNNATGRCQFLMMQTDCADGEWFILDKETRQASCRAKPCSGKHVLYKGECGNRKDICPEGMDPLVNEYGEADCDCSVKHIFYARRNRCFPAFRQGPCRLGQYITLGKEGGECTDNVCFRDGAAFWPESRRCHRIKDIEDSPCSLGRLDVNVDTLQLECTDTQLNAIFDLPVVRCSAGSKLDYQGGCRQELFQKFRSSLINKPSRRGRQCGEGYIKAPSGRCLKASGNSKLG